MTILIINGPNLNLLGTREPTIYGNKSYEDLKTDLQTHAKKLAMTIDIYQTNFEGIIIDLMHHAHHKPYDAIIINGAALSHYSYAIVDAISAIDIPVINVHLTDPLKRKESFRHTDVIALASEITFKGKGFNSYIDALDYINTHLKK